MENRDAKNWNNFFLGILVIILPFLGLPAGFKVWASVIVGFLVVIFSLANLKPRRTVSKSLDHVPPSQT